MECTVQAIAFGPIVGRQHVHPSLGAEITHIKIAIPSPSFDRLDKCILPVGIIKLIGAMKTSNGQRYIHAVLEETLRDVGREGCIVTAPYVGISRDIIVVGGNVYLANDIGFALIVGAQREVCLAYLLTLGQSKRIIMLRAQTRISHMAGVVVDEERIGIEIVYTRAGDTTLIIGRERTSLFEIIIETQRREEDYIVAMPQIVVFALEDDISREIARESIIIRKIELLDRITRMHTSCRGGAVLAIYILETGIDVMVVAPNAPPRLPKQLSCIFAHGRTITLDVTARIVYSIAIVIIVAFERKRVTLVPLVAHVGVASAMVYLFVAGTQITVSAEIFA